MMIDGYIRTIEQLLKYANEKGVVEVVIRDKGKKFKKFFKLGVGNLAQRGVANQQMAGRLINAVNNVNPIGIATDLIGNGVNTAIGLKSLDMLHESLKILKKSYKMLVGIKKLTQLNLLLSGANLCATCAGFAIMFQKLDKMSLKIDAVLGAVKGLQQNFAKYEFKKVLSEHSDMLDSRRLQKPYSEEKMRELVDNEYNVLDLLVEAFMNDSTGNDETLIFSIYSLASMLAVSIMHFDEVYYYTNKENLTDGKVWHASHDTWMSIFDRIADDEFVKKVQDFGFFELDLNTEENDYYYKSLHEQVVSHKEEIEDNQRLIEALEDEINYRKYFELINSDIKETMENIFAEAGISTDDEIAEVMNDAFERVAMA